jgi:hypothetical protein
MCKQKGSHDSSVDTDTVTGYSLVDRKLGILFPARVRNFPLLHSSQTCFGVYSTSYPMGTEICFLGDKAIVTWK